MPHSTYTCSVEHLAEVAQVLTDITRSPGTPDDPTSFDQLVTNVTGNPTLSDQLVTNRSDGSTSFDQLVTNLAPVLHTHVSENAAENAGLADRLGATPTELLARAGILSDADPARVVFGHGVHLSDSDRAAAATAGVTVAHCPGSNLKLASGALDWEQWRADGIRMGIGTDGCASSNDLDMWQAMRQAAHLAALTSGRPDIDATEILRAATIDGATALGMDGLIGSLEVGKRADLVLLDLEQPHLTPVHDVPALLVHAAGRGDVSHVLVDGRIVVSECRSTRLDTGELLRRCRTRARDAAAAALAAQKA
jgi:5-methylthioadenosine/S-adenosylhomocysteine deaminase